MTLLWLQPESPALTPDFTRMPAFAIALFDMSRPTPVGQEKSRQCPVCLRQRDRFSPARQRSCGKGRSSSRRSLDRERHAGGLRTKRETVPLGNFPAHRIGAPLRRVITHVARVLALS